MSKNTTREAKKTKEEKPIKYWNAPYSPTKNINPSNVPSFVKETTPLPYEGLSPSEGQGLSPLPYEMLSPLPYEGPSADKGRQSPSADKGRPPSADKGAPPVPYGETGRAYKTKAPCNEQGAS